MSDELEVIIAALPVKEDNTVRASSEPVAHMTMLYLGKVADSIDLSAIRAAVVEASQNLTVCTTPVIARTLLGDDKADVLMLDPGPLAVVRERMLAYPAVKRAYDSTEQYPEWTPHLTLGYPDKPPLGPYSSKVVVFDRLALWARDYEGEEFPFMRPAPVPVTAAVIAKDGGAVVALENDRFEVQALALFTESYAFYRDQGDWIALLGDEDEDPLSGLRPTVVDEDFVELFDEAERSDSRLDWRDIERHSLEKPVTSAADAQIIQLPNTAQTGRKFFVSHP